MGHEVICSKVDLGEDGRVTWTWDPSTRILTVSQGEKCNLGPNLVHVKYEKEIISTICLLGPKEDQACSTASFLSNCLLRPKDETNLEPNGKKELLMSLSLPSLYNKPAAMRKVRESIAKQLAC